MKNFKLFLAVLLACIALTSCAPVILGRTPQPAAPKEWTFSLNAGYPLVNPNPDDLNAGPTQVTRPHPVNLLIARGVGGNTELNGTFSISLTPALRLGGKTLLVGGTVPMAVDYGVSLPFNIVFDAGLLFSYPQPGVEPYGALRGLVTNVASLPGLAGALTVGADIPTGSGNFFVELTAATTTFAGREYYYVPVPPIGFSIVPALGYRF